MDEQWDVDMSALRAEFNRPTVVRMFFYPSDLAALLDHVPNVEAAIDDRRVFHAGSIDVCVGHPIRPGLVRAERSDGSFFLIPLTKMPPFCFGCMCFRSVFDGVLVRDMCRPCGLFDRES